MFQDLSLDRPPTTVLLCTALRTRVLVPQISKSDKIRFFGVAVLNELATLCQVDCRVTSTTHISVQVPVDATHDNAAADAGYTLLLQLCTQADTGICFKPKAQRQSID